MHKFILPLLFCLAAADFSFGQSVNTTASPTAGRHIVTSDGVDLYVMVKGAGTPCLYIHGGPGSGSWWLEKFSGEMMEKHFRMIYLDQRGTGRSSSPKVADYSMERMVRDFEEVRKTLGIREWVIMGHSFGGILQMGYARQCPRAIKGMIMLNCSLSMTESLTAAIPKACEFLGIGDTKSYTDGTIPLLERIQSLYGELRDRDLFWKMGYASRESNRIMDASFDEIPDWNKDLENVAMAVKDYIEDFRDAAPGMKMPVLFFYGRSDWLVGPEHFRGVHFPNMIRWGSDVGHMPFLENKADLEKAIAGYQREYRL